MNSVYEPTLGTTQSRMSGWDSTITYWHKIERHFLEVVEYQATHLDGHGNGCKVIVEQDECS